MVLTHFGSFKCGSCFSMYLKSDINNKLHNINKQLATIKSIFKENFEDLVVESLSKIKTSIDEVLYEENSKRHKKISVQPSNFKIFCCGKENAEVTIPRYILPQIFLDNVLAKAGRFYIKSFGIYLGNLGKNLTRSKLVRLLPLLHISPRIKSIMCTITVVQILLYKYCYMQCNVLCSHVKNCVLKIISNALLEFKSKDKYERKRLNKLKRNVKRKIYINSICLMSEVLFFFGTGR